MKTTIYKLKKQLLLPLLLLPIGLVAQQAEKSCVDCHQEQVSKNFVHGPTATDCTSCHEPTGVAHNNENTTGGFKLFAEGKAMCYDCHTELEEQFKARYVHKPLKEGDCTSCHDPHTANTINMVAAETPDLCLSCHEKFVAKKETATHIHTPSFEGESCAMCHTPHASKQKRLLTKGSKELCLDCHDKVIKRKDETFIANIGEHIEKSSHIHKALNKRCTSCHNAHFESRPLMLKEEFTIGSYVKGIEENFQLCFDCHDPDLLKLEKTSEYTQFRDGDLNLHFLHVNKDKGRNCTTCHDLHAANNAQLIAETVKFGRWNMPLNYLPTEDGGTCATGCHKEQSYSRDAQKVSQN